MAQDVTALGILTGNEEKAEEFIAFYNDVMDEVAEAVRDAADIPVVYLFLWLPPHRIIQWKYVMNMQAGING
jgi:ABC-type Fe3+-hydroxamate transport system substrate-binding protein